MKASVMK